MLTSTKASDFIFDPIPFSSYNNTHHLFTRRVQYMNYFSENLLYYRKKRGMTQNDIARKVFVKHQTISNYEKNTRTCDLNTLVLLSNALDITLDELIKNPHP